MNSPDQWFDALLEERAPANVLQLGAVELPALSHYAQATSVTRLQRDTVQALLDAPLDARVDLCVVQADFVHSMGRQAITAIAGIRNQYCHNVYLFIPRDELARDDDSVSLNDLLGLGMRKLAEFENDGRWLDCYGYEMLRYNKKRSWNNAKFWANPENFGKYWW